MIAIDTISNSGAWNNAQSSVTWAHTCNGDNRALVVGVTNYASGRTISGVTYNATGLTAVGSRISYNSSTRWVTAWVLANPSSGANNIVVTLSGNDYVRTTAVSLTGAKQSGQPNTSSDKTSTITGNETQAVTTTGTNWLIWLGDSNGAGSAGTGTTSIYLGVEAELLKSTTVVSAGSNTLALNSVTGVFAFKLVAIEELAAVGPAKLKTANTLAVAKLKTKNTLAIAKIKTINTLA